MTDELNPRDAHNAAWGNEPPEEPKPNGSRPLPTIEVRAGDRHLAADDGLDALHKAGTEFFQRGGSLVHVCPIKVKTADGETTFAPGIITVSHAMLGRELGRVADWVRIDKDGKKHRTDPPKAVVEQIAGMVGEWPFPTLAGVIGTPTLRPDGSILATQGYDPKTGLFLFGGPALSPGAAFPFGRRSRRRIETRTRVRIRPETILRARLEKAPPSLGHSVFAHRHRARPQRGRLVRRCGRSIVRGGGCGVGRSDVLRARRSAR
jgi:hypothetical protein